MRGKAKDRSGKIRTLSWRLRLMGIILLGAAILLSVSFWGAYKIFIKSLEETNLRATALTFEQTERNINRKLQQAADSANRLLDEDIVLQYLAGKTDVPAERSREAMKMVEELTAVLNYNPDLSGIALINEKGHALGITDWKMTAVADLLPGGEGSRFLEKSESRYPFYMWFGAEEVREQFDGKHDFLDFFEGHGSVAVKMLVGIRTISSGDNKSSYLLVSVGDVELRECYTQVLYNENTAVLLDGNKRIISRTDNGEINEKPEYAALLPDDSEVGEFSFKKECGEEYQIIYYELPQYGWTLVNEIPKKVYWQQADELREVLLFLWFFTLSLMFVFFIAWIGKYTRPVEQIIQGMKRVQEGNLEPVCFPPSGIAEMDELGEQFGITVDTIRTLIGRVRSMDQEMAEEELKTLQYQINPHFLYNSLNSIRWMAVMNNNPKVADALLLLARIIEPILRSPSSSWTVREELDFLDSYVKMLTLRFGGALEYGADCDNAIGKCNFPKFTLQPILENCFIHGMIPGDTMKIRIKIERKDGMLTASVENTGNKIEREVLKNLNEALEHHKEPDAAAGSIGLLNVNKRLFLLYGMEADMHVYSGESEYTAVVVKIPEKVGTER